MAKTMQEAVDRDFTVRLPKAELHAHLSGSVDVDCLHRIWVQKQAQNQCLDLEDPVTVIRPDGKFHDIVSFFPVFDKYIYSLCNDLETIKFMTTSVLENFRNDGVVHLELRTTPRDNTTSGLTKEAYVAGVLEAIRDFNLNPSNTNPHMETTLILSIDRRMTPSEASRVVDIAIAYQHPDRKPQSTPPQSPDLSLNLIVALDLSGNPARGDVAAFTPFFHRAKASGLGLTVHFAEIPASSTDIELETILSWQPERLGHVIHVAPRFERVLEERRLGLELCLSCNVLSGMTGGGYEGHHFGYWWGRLRGRGKGEGCAIALGTDDVGIFGRGLGEEYFLAAKAFGLGRREVVGLSRSAAEVVFTGRGRLEGLIDGFEEGEGMDGVGYS